MEDSVISTRNVSLVAGGFYLLTSVSIPTLSLYGPVHDPDYVVGPGPDTPVLIGAILEWIVALANVGTAIALYPLLKRQDESLALGFVGSRTLESATIIAGIACLLSVVTLRQSGDGAHAVGAGRALVAVYDRTFLLGQNLMPPLNALLLGSLLYRSRLVPRALPLLGFIGAPLLIAAQGAVLFGYIERVSPWTAVAALPIALWEFSLGLWLVFKGFDASAADELLKRA
jgi:hypothetical protein